MNTPARTALLALLALLPSATIATRPAEAARRTPSQVQNSRSKTATSSPIQTPKAKIPIPTELYLEPRQVTLQGPGAAQSLIVTGRFADGTERDVTAQAHFRTDRPAVATVDAEGVLKAVGDGMAWVKAELGGRTATLLVKVSGTAVSRGVSFTNDVMAVLTKAGCNQGACHGSPAGKGGLKLSMFGYDPALDQPAIVTADGGRRVDLKEVPRSLLLQKPTAAVPHGGGQRFAVGSPEYRVLRGWLEAGAPADPPETPHIIGLQVLPAARSMAALKATQRLVVMAQFSDGSAVDVTRNARLTSNDDAVAALDGATLTAAGVGETAVMARYLGQVAISRVTVPPAWPEPKLTGFRPSNNIDRLVARKWQELRLAPSELSTDAEFLRRASLDTIGLPPTPDEVRQFLADRDPAKRAKQIDALLARPEYVDRWTQFWSDLLRVSSRFIVGEPEKAYRSWIHDSVVANKPYDQFARELLTATGDITAPGPGSFFQVARTAEDRARDAAQIFLGVRIECAQCHNHPFEKWTRDHYFGLAAFFAQARTAAAPDKKVMLTVDMKGELRHPERKTPVVPAVLDTRPVTVAPETDRREALAGWVTDARNPFFARAIANRLWAHFFGRGLVDPVDDFRETNPASNEPLLAALALQLTAHGYDLKFLMREIMNSRAYQLSSAPNRWNEHDGRNFARAYLRRLPAQQLLDSVCQVTGVPERFNGQPPGTRAAQLPDSRVGSYFLDVFGRSRNDKDCTCDAILQGSVPQALHLLNGATLETKLAAADGTVAKLAASTMTNEAVVTEIYLGALGREPSTRERHRALDSLAKAPARRAELEDLMWALLNSREFMFNH